MGEPDEPTERGATAQDLPRLIARLVERSIFLIEQRVALAEDEIRAQLRRAMASAWQVGLALLLAIIGAGLLSLGLCALLVVWGMPAWLALILLALAYLTAAGVILGRLTRRAPGERVLGRTLAELDKDRAWLKGRT